MSNFKIFPILLLLISCKKIDYSNKKIDLTPTHGDLLVEASIGDASFLNPVLASDSASFDIIGLVYSSLIKFDRNLNFSPNLASSWTISNDGKTLTFFLKKNIKWHDGHPFSSRDVKFTYQKFIDPNVKTAYSADYLVIDKVLIPDDFTVKVIYKQPYAPALFTFGGTYIIPEHIFSKGDFNNHPNNRKPIGTGPYKFVEWKTDQKIVLEANQDYFEGPPFIKKIVYRIIPDLSVQFLELRRQSIDLMGLSPDQYLAYKDFFKNYNKFKFPTFSYTYLGFNLNSSLFKNLKVRKAIAMAINKEDIIKGVLLGLGRAATGPFPPLSFGFNENVKDVEYAPEVSKKLLSEEGWRLNKDGILQKDSIKFEFTIMTNQGNKSRELIAQIIQKQLKTLGIKVNIRIIEWSTFIQQYIDKKNFDAVILGWAGLMEPTSFAYHIWHSSQRKEGGFNFIDYYNPEVDRLLEIGRKTVQRKKQIEIYKKIFEMIVNDVPCVFLYYPESLPVIHKRFYGIDPAPVASTGILWNIEKIFVPKDLQKYPTIS